MNRNLTVAEVAGRLAGDPSVTARVEQRIAASEMVATLIGLRVKRKKTQTEIARHMGCTPGRISKLEGGSDENLKWTDIVGYVEATGMTMSFLVDDPELPQADKIKHYVFQIDKLLKDLAKWAVEVGETAIVEGVKTFNGDVLLNVSLRCDDNYNRLTPRIQIGVHRKSADLTEVSPTQARAAKEEPAKV